MNTAILATANAFELQDAAHRGYTPNNFDTSSRSSDEIRPPASLGTRQASRGSEIDITRTPFDAQPITSPPSQTKSARANLIILQVSIIIFLTSISSGLIVVGLPRIAADLHLEGQLYLWPSSVFGLTAGSSLLLAGAVADVVGARSVDLFGCILLGVFTLACGFSQTGIQLVMFRAFQGVATAIHLPCSVSLVTHSVPSGKARSSPALVPNYLWKNLPFSSVCALTLLTWGVQNSMELFSSL
jgi:hypothetical protein